MDTQIKTQMTTCRYENTPKNLITKEWNKATTKQIP